MPERMARTERSDSAHPTADGDRPAKTSVRLTENKPMVDAEYGLTLNTVLQSLL